MAETTGVFFRTLSNSFPPIAFSHIPLHAGFSPFLTLGYSSSFHHFVTGCEVARPHCLINMTSYCCLQSGIAWWFVVSTSSCRLLTTTSFQSFLPVAHGKRSGTPGHNTLGTHPRFSAGLRILQFGTQILHGSTILWTVRHRSQSPFVCFSQPVSAKCSCSSQAFTSKLRNLEAHC